MAYAKILGTTGDVTQCECCGKDNLKKTVALDVDGDVRYYGTTCVLAVLVATNHPRCFTYQGVKEFDPATLQKIVRVANREGKLRKHQRAA